MLLADNERVEDTRGGVEGVDSWVDTELRNASGQHRGGVQVSESGRRGGIGQIVGGHVDGLATERSYHGNEINFFLMAMT